MNNYVVATIKDWQINQFNSTTPELTGNWSLISDKSQLTMDSLRLINPKYIFFPHWSWIVPDEILNEFTCVCFHMTDLPYGRGGSPLQNLIARGHNETKLTALKMTNELDAGPIYLKAPLSLQGSAQEIFERSAELIFEMIASIIKLEPVAIEQTGEVTLFDRRVPEQSKMPAKGELSELYDLIRMMDADSYPRAFIDYGDFTLQFRNAKLNNEIIDAAVTISKRDSKKDSKRDTKTND